MPVPAALNWTAEKVDNPRHSDAKQSAVNAALAIIQQRERNVRSTRPEWRTPASGPRSSDVGGFPGTSRNREPGSVSVSCFPGTSRSRDTRSKYHAPSGASQAYSVDTATWNVDPPLGGGDQPLGGFFLAKAQMMAAQAAIQKVTTWQSRQSASLQQSLEGPHSQTGVTVASAASLTMPGPVAHAPWISQQSCHPTITKDGGASARFYNVQKQLRQERRLQRKERKQEADSAQSAPDAEEVDSTYTNSQAPLVFPGPVARVPSESTSQQSSHPTMTKDGSLTARLYNAQKQLREQRRLQRQKSKQEADRG